jgi:23S rRNA pseudouridine2604 synthase
MTMRINKFLSEAGAASRRGADVLIEAGEVTIDGRPARLGDTVEPGQVVCLKGRVVPPREKFSYLLFNKPVGVITTTDRRYRDNILEALEKAGWPLAEERVFPVGRLDVASSGLILFTNDSAVADRILRSAGRHEKEYLVTVDKPLTPAAVRAMERGIRIMGQMTLPAKVRQLKEDHFSIAIVQGMNRQIRRMCTALGYEVKTLKRVRIMHLHLDKLQQGEYRSLTDGEIAELRRAVGLD